MGLSVPSSLSPSKLSSFTTCALRFRFASIDKLPEPPTRAASRGTLVHAGLERLFTLPEAERVPAAAGPCLDAALDAYRDDPEWTGLALDADAETAVVAEARHLIDNYFLLEDPRQVVPIGIELQLEVDIGGVTIRGIIDRLDLVDGELVVTDYKTGRPPSDRHARTSMTGVHVYSLLCERHFGRRPTRVQLLHLAEPVAIVAEPTEQSTRGLERRLQAVWRAVESACEHDDFRPRPSRLCDWCAFQRWCPSFGGDPSRAAIDVQVSERAAAGQEPLLQI
jgi:putative RecB family exonuclease